MLFQIRKGAQERPQEDHRQLTYGSQRDRRVCVVKAGSGQVSSSVLSSPSWGFKGGWFAVPSFPQRSSPPAAGRRQGLPRTHPRWSPRPLLEQTRGFGAVSWPCHAERWGRGSLGSEENLVGLGGYTGGLGEERVNTIGFGIWQGILMFNHS